MNFGSFEALQGTHPPELDGAVRGHTDENLIQRREGETIHGVRVRHTTPHQVGPVQVPNVNQFILTPTSDVTNLRIIIQITESVHLVLVARKCVEEERFPWVPKFYFPILSRRDEETLMGDEQ